MSKIPTLFISHGSPDLPLRPSLAHDFFLKLGQQLEKPKAILVISAHWNTTFPTVSAAIDPKIIHDFVGFPTELFQLNYPAIGAPQLAHQTNDLLKQNGFTSEIVTERGLDHGAWNPLMLIYPDADIAVTQLSIQPHQDANYHFRLGQAIASLKEEGTLILASGSATHNLREIGKYTSPPNWVLEFSDWLSEKLIAGDWSALLDYENLAPYAKRNHPSSEHLLPLFVAMGASTKDSKAVQLHSSYTYGVLSMAAFAFE